MHNVYRENTFEMVNKLVTEDLRNFFCQVFLIPLRESKELLSVFKNRVGKSLKLWESPQVYLTKDIFQDTKYFLNVRASRAGSGHVEIGFWYLKKIFISRFVCPKSILCDSLVIQYKLYRTMTAPYLSSLASCDVFSTGSHSTCRNLICSP